MEMSEEIREEVREEMLEEIRQDVLDEIREIREEIRDESASLVGSLAQIAGFLLTKYPMVSPLLEQLKEDLADAFEQVVDLLPRVSRALNEIEVDRDATERFTNQLIDAVPELERFFRRLRDR
ncbi:MAG TPA: hypothetical protein GX014_10040 [Firmicutes bacterium]|jgi:NifB/MoaA-like Fe-S oxidoreductase|nr:hypothetical protein [Bacillota bacterium]